jgi:hypothetical protein
VCDGFENGLAAWSVESSGGGAVATDRAHVFRGNFAMHAQLGPVTTTGAVMQAVVQRTQAWPEPMFIRFFVYMPSPSPTSAAVLLDLNTAAGGMLLLLLGGGGQITLESFGLPDAGSATSTAMPLDQWVCIEEELDGSSVTLYRNGTRILTKAFPVPTQGIVMDLGLTYDFGQMNDPAHEAWFDEFAVDTTRVGCDR